MSRILLIEDEIILGETIVLSLKKMGFTCDWVKTLKEAKKKLTDQAYAVWVLDRQLPDGEGTTLLTHEGRSHSRVLVLSSKSSVNDRVYGLKAGADDYLPKPFSFVELEARLHALLRRGVDLPPPALKNRNWEVKEKSLSVFFNGQWLEFTPLEFKFLKYLMDRQDTIVSKDRLLRDVWGFRLLPKTRTVDYVITQLRRRLEPDSEKPKHLLTIRGAGVKFVP